MMADISRMVYEHVMTESTAAASGLENWNEAGGQL
jgi:hypothetical protein